MKTLWPHQHFKYSEDVVLSFLQSFNYDHEMALTSVVVNLQSLAKSMQAADARLERTVACYGKLDKDIEHSFYATRKVPKLEKSSLNL